MFTSITTKCGAYSWDDFRGPACEVAHGVAQNPARFVRLLVALLQVAAVDPDEHPHVVLQETVSTTESCQVLCIMDTMTLAFGTLKIA